MDKVFLGQRLGKFEPGLEHLPISRVDLLDENGDLLHTAGDDTGRTLEAVHPDATQEMAESILASVRGFTYRPYEAQEALLDPAAELGDGITLGGVYSLLAHASTDYDALCLSDLEAPASDEIDEEYPYQDPLERLIQRNIQSVRSFITKTAEEINLTVEDLDKQLGTTLRVGLDGVTITNATGQSVTISGSQIDAKTINAADIDAKKIRASDLQLSGVLSFGDLTGTTNVALKTDIPSDSEITTITKNAIRTATINASQITTGAFAASSLSLDGLLALKHGTTTYGYMGVNLDKGGPSISDSGKNNFFVATANAAKISYKEQKMIWVANGGCYSSEAMQVYSDRRLKNSIDYDFSKEEVFFELLRPCSFQMNGDETGKKRWGFVAQDVIESAVFAGIDPEKLAAIGSYESMNTLAYGEFTALNTYMIQRLMNRVADLDRRIQEVTL